MTTLQIPDDLLKRAGITERQAVLEFACRLYETGRLSLFFSAQLAGLTQPEFEDALLDRKIPIHRYTEDDLRADLQSLRASEP